MQFRVPHTLVLLFGMCVVAWLMTYVVPQGRFQREKNEAGREVVVDGSYARIAAEERVQLPVWGVFTAIPKGLASAQDIVFFVFIIGGFFGVLRATGAIDAAIGALLRSLGRWPNGLIAGSLLAFAVGSSTIGMAEEYVPFVPVLVLLCTRLRLDAMTAVAIIAVGSGIGYGAAAMNPFTVVVAQKVAGLEPLSGIELRLIIFPLFYIIGAHHILRYARRVRTDPTLSLVAADAPQDESQNSSTEVAFTGKRIAVLLVTIASLVGLVVGIAEFGWYLGEMAALFSGLTILVGALGFLAPSVIAKKFCEGAAELTTTALLIGIARAIEVLLTDGAIIDTVVYAIAQPLSELGASAAAVGMFLVQSACNLFIPSGSGQAYVTMPVMAPLSDLVGVPRQVAVLAYQFGDGFTNMLIPTNAVLIGVLTMAKVPYDRWLRFVLPLMAKFAALAVLILAAAVGFGYA